MNRNTFKNRLIVTAALLTSVAAQSQAQLTFFATQNQGGVSQLYRFTLTGAIDTFATSHLMTGMTTVPLGATLGNMNGGATGGDVVGSAGGAFYRLDNAFGTTPNFVQITAGTALNASPFFVGNQLFATGAALPDGAYFVELDPLTGNEISREAMGFLGSAGGGVTMPNGDIWYEEHNLDRLMAHTPGTTTSSVISGLPNFDYCGMERYNGVNYTMLGLNPGGTGRWVLGQISDSGVYSQLRDIDLHVFNGQTGMTVATPVPEPATLCMVALGLAGILASPQASGAIMADNVSKPYFKPGGTLDPSAPSYIAREADDRLFEALSRGEYVFLLDSRQKGKSSMVARSILRLREAGIVPVKLDLQRIGANVTPEQWYAGLLAGIGQELGVVEALFAYWSERQSVGPLARWIGTIEEIVLAREDRPVVIFIDEIDFVRALPFSTDEFFAGIRECYNRRAEGNGFGRLTFCLVGVATPGQLIRNPEITPFNIGTRLEVSDFTEDEIAGYAAVLETQTRDGPPLVKRIHYWLNGHPYLTQLLCSELAARPEITDPADVDRLVRQRFLSPDARQSESNFADVERRILTPDLPGLSAEEKRTQVLDIYGHLLKGKRVEADQENPLIATLLLAGVAAEGGGKLRLRNRLYGELFNESWRVSSLPDAEVRRQRRAARKAAIATAGVAAVLVAILGSMTFAIWRASREREVALEELQKRSRELLRQNYAGSMGSIRTEIGNGQWQRVANLVDRTATHPDRGWEWGHAHYFLNRHESITRMKRDSFTFEHPLHGVMGVNDEGVFDLNGDRAALWKRLPVEKGFRTIYSKGPYMGLTNVRRSIAIDIVSGQKLLDAEGNLYGIDIVRRRLVTRLKAPSAVLSVRTFENKPLFTAADPTGARVRTGEFLPDGTLLTLSVGGEALLWSPAGRIVNRYETNQEAVNHITLSPKGDFAILTGLSNPTIPAINLKDLKRRVNLGGHRGPTTCSAFSRSGRFAATGSNDGSIRVYEFPSGRPVSTFVGHKARVVRLHIDEARQVVTSIDFSGEVRRWVLKGKPPVDIYKQHRSQANLGLVIGTTLVSSGLDGQVVARNLVSGKILRLRVNKFGEFPRIANVNGALLVGLSSGSVRMLNPTNFDLISEARSLKSPITSICVSGDGSTAIVANVRTGATILDTSTLNPRFDVGIEDGPIVTAASSKDGQLVTVGTGHGVLLLLDGASGRILGRWTDPERLALRSVAISHDERLLATGGSNGEIYLFNIEKLSPKTVLRGHAGRAWKLAFSPDDQMLASASFDGTARLWDMKTMKERATLYHRTWVTSVAFNGDGSRVITAADDNTASVWETESGYETMTLSGHTATVWDAFFTKGGRDVVTVSSDGTVRIWHSSPWK